MDERRSVEEIMDLHQKIVATRTSHPWKIESRKEYLRGWERALLWVMNQEDPPTELLGDE